VAQPNAAEPAAAVPPNPAGAAAVPVEPAESAHEPPQPAKQRVTRDGFAPPDDGG
jgi:hypothetical protein